MHPQTGEIWQHHRTKGEYEVLATGKLQVTFKDLDMEECVIYKALSDQSIWVRPLVDFIGDVETEEGEMLARFSKVS